MGDEFYSRLKDIMPRYMSGFSDIVLNEGVFEDIQLCIESEVQLHNLEGYYFLDGCLSSHELSEFPHSFVSSLVNRTRELIENVDDIGNQRALRWYTFFRDNYQDYRDVMLNLLSDGNFLEKSHALEHYVTYAMQEEYYPLLQFENDDNLSECLPHGAAWEYALRNKALKLIHKVSRLEFHMQLISVPGQGSTVSWYSWDSLKRARKAQLDESKNTQRTFISKVLEAVGLK